MGRVGAAWRKFTAVPETWEGWTVRVLTLAVVLMMAAVGILMVRIGTLSDQLSDVSTSIDQVTNEIHIGRADRQGFQRQELARQCAILSAEGVPVFTREALGCSS